MLRREIYFIGCLITAIIVVPMISLAASRDGSRHIQEMLAANALILQTRLQEKQSLERDLTRHEQDLAIARQHYLDQQIQLQHLLVALQRLARTPPESILSQPESPERVVRGGILLRAAIRNLEQKLGPLRADLNHFEQLRQNVEARKQALTRLSDELQQQDQDLENLIAKRQQDQPLETTLSPLPAIGLGELVKKIDQSTIEAARIETDKPDLAQKIIWQLPLAGSIVPAPPNQDHPGEGIWLNAPPNSIILSPADGMVRYSGPFRGYGSILIVEHAGGYHSLLAGVDSIMVTTGQQVLGGEPIARIADPENTNDRPKGVAGLPPDETFRTLNSGKLHPLYFEVRYHGKSEMPDRLVTLLKKKDSVP